MFGEYYKLRPVESKKIWHDCVFAFDANVLLDIYRYSADSRKELLTLIKALGSRVWVPHQAALEFHRNRLAVISQVHDEPQKLIAAIEAISIQLDNKLSRHPYLTRDVTESIKSHLILATGVINTAKSDHPDLLVEDRIGDELAQLLEDKVGSPFSEEDLQKQHAQIDLRYANKIPPGYEDTKDKAGTLSHGDALIWFQLLEYGSQTGRAIIFVTGERKEDWWLRHKGKTLQPRPELRKEYKEHTGQEFYMYEGSHFIEVARRELAVKVSNALLEEAKQLERAHKFETETLARSRRYEDRLSESDKLRHLRNAIVHRADPKSIGVADVQLMVVRYSDLLDETRAVDRELKSMLLAAEGPEIEPQHVSQTLRLIAERRRIRREARRTAEFLEDWRQQHDVRELSLPRAQRNVELDKQCMAFIDRFDTSREQEHREELDRG